MKPRFGYFRSVGMILLTLSFGGCLFEDPVSGCMCTMEFRAYAVTVVDANGVPADSAIVTVKNLKTGKEYKFEPHSWPFEQGVYEIMHDGYMKDFTDGPVPVGVTAKKRNVSATGVWQFATDDCDCHVWKVSGPDTLVLR